MDADPHHIYFVVIHRETLMPIRIFRSVAQARDYLKPVLDQDEDIVSQFQIERVYIDSYVDKPGWLLLTFLDRPSAKSISEAIETKKIQRIRIKKAKRVLRFQLGIDNDSHSKRTKEAVRVLEDLQERRRLELNKLRKKGRR